MELHLPYKLLFLSIIPSLTIVYFLGTTYLSTFISGVIIISGITLGLWCKKIMNSYKTTLNPSGKPTTLITSGPFKLSRNPMYVSYLLVAIGFALFSDSWLGFIGPILYFIYLNFKIIPEEEQNLRDTFKNDYLVYTNKVRRWL